MGRAYPRPTLSSWAWAGAVALLLLGLQAGGDATRVALRLDPAELSQGQWWRLLTAHFVHLSWPHAWLNVAGVMLCCALAPNVFDHRLPWRLVALALGISLCLWGFSSAVLPYVGLSGVLYGLFVLGLAPRALRRDGQAIAALALITGWMLWQWYEGPLPAEEHLIGGPIIEVAHLYGYGLAVAMLLAARAVRRGRRTSARRA